MTENKQHDRHKRDEQYMAYALAQARRAERHHEVPVGAVVVQAERVVAEAHNQTIAQHDPSAHAEILALRLAGRKLMNYRLPDAALYVTLEPCAMCYAAVVHARLARLVYAAGDPKSGVLGGVADFSRLPFFNHCPEIVHGILAEEAGSLLKDFFVLRRP